ncbi:MAG: 3-deoxy-D-manno-octulosonic acid transferase [Caulobacteraceae bacterium]
MSAALPPSLRLYRLASALASPIAPLVLSRRAARGKEDAGRRGERLGITGLPRPSGRLVWLHGASVGEGLSLLPLVEMFGAERPGAAVLVTSGTVASARLLAGRLPRSVIHQYAPIDTPRTVNRFLDHWCPDLGVFAESELWPNLILSAKARGAKLALVSARMSARSLRGWRRAPRAARTVLNAFDLILARDEVAAQGLAAFGVAAHGLADLKFGAAPLPFDERELAALRSVTGRRTIILAASTHPGEESLVVEGFAAAATGATDRALLVLAPRHGGRAEEIETTVRRAGLSVSRRGDLGNPGGTDVYIADQLGELGLWFRLATLAIIGGSLVRGVGGHNPLEPVRIGCPFVSGPNVESWPVYGELAALGNPCLVSGGLELESVIRQALVDPAAFEAPAVRSRAFVEAKDVEMASIMRRIVELIDP